VIDVNENQEMSVNGLYAVDDVTHGQNQTTIAIGDGAYTGLTIHRDMRRFPKSFEELKNDETPVADTVPGTPPDLRAQMRRVRDLKTHPGLHEPSPEQG
jgi:thioredoxin reductase (NADPH)